MLSRKSFKSLPFNTTVAVLSHGWNLTFSAFHTSASISSGEGFDGFSLRKANGDTLPRCTCKSQKSLSSVEFELCAADVACKPSHICALVSRQHHHIEVVALFVLDVQRLARHTAVDVHNSGGILGGNDSGMSQQLIAYANTVQIACYFINHDFSIV